MTHWCSSSFGHRGRLGWLLSRYLRFPQRARRRRSIGPETVVHHPARTYTHHYTHHNYTHHYVWRNGADTSGMGISYALWLWLQSRRGGCRRSDRRHPRAGAPPPIRTTATTIRMVTALASLRRLLGRLLRALLRRLRLWVRPRLLRPWLLWPWLLWHGFARPWLQRRRWVARLRRRQLRPHGRLRRRPLGGFGGGHMGGFGGGHMGGFGGGAHFR